MYIATTEIITNIAPLFLGIFLFWQSLIPVAANLLMGGNKGGGGWSGPPPVAEASQEEKDLLGKEQGIWDLINKTYEGLTPYYLDRMQRLNNGELPENTFTNWMGAFKPQWESTTGKSVSELNKRGILSSSATTSMYNKADENAKSSYAQHRLGLMQQISDNLNKQYAITSDNLKYPYNAWNSMRGQRYTNSNNQGYKPAEPNPMTGLYNGIGGMFNWGGGSSGGGSNNIVGPLPGLNAGNAWGNASYW
jgi:hypothetical protein